MVLLQGSQCVDKNECLEMPGICGARGICRNDAGGYHCECPRGYRRGMGETCVGKKLVQLKKLMPGLY